MTDFVIRTGQFEGPLDLLLDLIEKKKLHINDVSLSQVTDDYVAYVRSLPVFTIGKTAHFILIASTLLLIKSKSLLPNLSLTDEEEADIKSLEERLKIYDRIRKLSRHISDRFGKEMLFARQKEMSVEPIFSPEKTITKQSVLESVRMALSSIPTKEFIPRTIVQKVISLEEVIGKLIERVQSSLQLSFREFSKITGGEKGGVIVSFLAMLELVKQGSIDVTQQSAFEDIQIESGSVQTPSYS